MRECNRCDDRNCREIAKHRQGTQILLSSIQLRASCPEAKQPQPYTEKLLLLAIGTNPQGVHDVLQAAGIVLREKTRYPFFQLILDNRGAR